jgi:hypothetical protein
MSMLDAGVFAIIGAFAGFAILMVGVISLHELGIWWRRRRLP